VMDAIGLAIAELVPSRYRGAYEDPTEFVQARRVLNELVET
jgi:hypothetical protein